MATGTRPERTAPADRFYDAKESSRYGRNARMRQIQTHLAQRAVQLLGLPARGGVVLDIGCGTGIGGAVLEKEGHTWVGLDVSMDMLLGRRRGNGPSDVVCADMGAGLPFRRKVFDGVISISALQWLCVSSRTGHRTAERLEAFMKSLHRLLAVGARAVFQLYPENPEQLALIRNAALGAGLGGGLVADYPRSEASKKFYLVLTSLKVAPAAMGASSPSTAQGVAGSKRRRPAAQAVQGGRRHGRDRTNKGSRGAREPKGSRRKAPRR